jgi:hypothetical protein
MGKRRFLSTLANLGVSATALSFITQDTLAEVTDNPKEEIPYVELLRHSNPEQVANGAAPEREPVWDTIPRAKWVRVEAAHDAAEKVNAQLSEQFDTSQITAGVTSRNGDSYQKEIVVDYVKMEHADGSVSSPSVSLPEVKGILPNSVSGHTGSGKNAETIQSIPVTVREQRIREAACQGGYYNDDFGDSIPGGCRTGDSGTTGTCCTAATRDSDSQNVMVHCAHAIDVSSGHLHQPGDAKSEEDLDVANYDLSGSNDSGYCTPYSGETFIRRLADDNGTVKSYKVMGIVTWDTLKNKEGDTSYGVSKQGNRSGTTSGYITDTNKNDGVKNVWTNCDGAQGDSGGPIYRTFYNEHFNQYEAYIAGVLAWVKNNPDNECPSNRSGGNAMEYVENKWSLTV